MNQDDKKTIDSRRGSEASTRASRISKSDGTPNAGDAEIANLKQQLEIQRLKAELAALKGPGVSDKGSRDRRWSSSSSSSSDSSSCGSSCSGNDSSSRPSNPNSTGLLDPFGRPLNSGLQNLQSRMNGGKIQGAKWRIVDITAGGVSCDKGTIPFNDFWFSDCKNIIRQYQPRSEAHWTTTKRQEAITENARKRKTFLETYTHVEFQTTFRHPELISKPKKKHHHKHHRHGHRRGSRGNEQVHTRPFSDPFNPFLGPRPGGF